MSNARKSSSKTDLPVKGKSTSAPASKKPALKEAAVKEAATKEPKGNNKQGKRKMDYGVTIKLLYGAAIVLAVGAFIVIGVKTIEDLSAERNASTLLSVYKDMETAQPATTLLATATPEAAEETPLPTPGVDTDVIAAQHRANEEDDLEVDETADYVQPDDVEHTEMEEIIQQIVNSVGDDGVVGTIEIPKTGQEYPIIGKWSYKLLKISICRYQGGLPNEFGSNLVLIGHNYKSGAHFGNLKNLEKGDEIYLTAKGGERIRYVVYDMETIAPDAFDELKEYRGESGLTLLTCRNNGNNRLIVRCEQQAVASAVSANGTGTNG